MPTRLMPGCSAAGCPNRAVEHGRGRCQEHARAYARERPSPARQGYDRAWQDVRAEYLSFHSKCEMHDAEALETHRIWGDAATDVHHRTGRSDHSFPNLCAMCHRCHSRETLRQQLSGNKR